jgi:diacylglycerol kinase (ATP)
VIVNAGSRQGKKAYERAVDMLTEAGVPIATTHAVTEGGDIAGITKRVIVDHDLVIVGGGDGTVGCAAGVLAGTDVALAILPLGTANDFARTLEVPRKLRTACGTAAHGKVVDVDLGRVNGRPCLNVASIGLSVSVTEALTPALKRRLGRLAYPVATMRAYRRHIPFRARLAFHDGASDALEFEDLVQVAVGNGRHYGGGNTVAPTAGIDDHALDVYAIVRGSIRDQVNIARQLKDGRFVEHERVHHVRTRALTLVTDEAMPVNVDGEIATETPCRFEIERNAVHVVVPQSATSASLDGPSAR